MARLFGSRSASSVPNSGQQRQIEPDLPRSEPGDFGQQQCRTARRTIRGFEAMLWLRKGFGFAGAWTVCEQNQLLSVCFGLPEVSKA
jgi:hypothetical protein